MPTEFEEKVYALCAKVPKGRVTTYKAIADALGTGAYRAVGQALRKNPYAPKVPCHRVVASDGSLGGFNGQTSGPFITKKKKLLETEGISIKHNSISDFQARFIRPR